MPIKDGRQNSTIRILTTTIELDYLTKYFFTIQVPSENLKGKLEKWLFNSVPKIIFESSFLNILDHYNH